MIICLYHGSTFKNVNEEQTRPVTEVIKDRFKVDVYEVYYSKRVCETLKRRENIDMSLASLLNKEYTNQDNIYILSTNVIYGEEYQNTLKIIKEIDKENKIKITKPLLNENSINEVAQAVVNKGELTIHVGHGNESNYEYNQLNDILKGYNNYVVTLKEDFKEFLNENIKENSLEVYPLMFTAAYHMKMDIENKFVKIAEDLGYNVNLQQHGLSKNENIIKLLINNLEAIKNN